MTENMTISTTFMRFSARLLVGLIGATLIAVFSSSTAFAQGSYETTIVSMSGNGSLTLEPGETTEVYMEFLNSGSATWYNDGAGYISVYTYGPKYRRSSFDPGTWLWGDHLKRISEAKVAPGEKATMAFELHAPDKEGYYEETFHLAAEDTAWVTGGEFTLKIDVTKDKPAVDNVKESTPTEDNLAEGYAAELIVKSANNIKTVAGRSILFTAGFKNTGSQVWSNYSIQKPGVALAANVEDFAHQSWNGSKLVRVDQIVKPGEMAVATFAFTAPKTNGIHTAKFQLSANGVAVPGAYVEIPVEVTGGAAAIVQQPVNPDTPSTLELIEEPDIRVGVLIIDEETENKVMITSHESDFRLRDVNGNLLAEVAKDTVVTAYYSEYRYFYDVGRGLEESTYGLRFEPVIENAVMEITNFDRRLTRGASYPDNTFRNVLEIRYNDYKNRTWVINELPMDYYLRGLAEASDYYPVEFHKAQVTAARSYAYFHYVRGGKRTSEYMHLNSTPSDQVYQGYGREARMPRVTQAVIDTAGMIVTYEGEVAVTPYYARSNGWTKDWGDVWWGEEAHLVAKQVSCDAGKSQWGHGVGMPQSGAKCMAEDGQTWLEILEYFYTDVEIAQQW